MYTCPGCSELIGDGYMKCPYCGHILTHAELMAMEDKESVEESQLEQNAIEVFAQRRAMHKKIMMGLCLAVAVTSLLLLAVGAESGLIIADIVVLSIIAVILIVKTKADYCPYCDTYIYRRGYTDRNTNCPNCGKRVL